LTGPLPTAVALDPTGTRAVAAIEAPRPDYLADADGALTVDDVQDVYRAAFAAGHLTDDLIAALKVRADAIKTESQKDPEPDADGVYPVEFVEDRPERPAWPEVAQPRA
jgi:hypothetical protein